MKRIIISAILVIVLLSVVLVTIAMNKTSEVEQSTILHSEVEQNEKLQSEAEQSTKLQSEAEQSEKLQQEFEQDKKRQYLPEERDELQNLSQKYEQVQYELICLTIEKNSDYYKSFSEKCIFEFEENGYAENFAVGDLFNLEKIEDKLEDEYNTDLLSGHMIIHNIEGIILVQLQYAVSIEVYYFSDGFVDPLSYDCSVIYVPDEYMNEESIAALKTRIDSLENIKDNLFIVKHTLYDY
jgi:hypothetical protein